ncbi:adenylate/guanylate cyclase domain-containing protein [Streptomyces sp. NPDC048604]|uniref:adenylate/guanylate cyclase domain-containing protein n=1 Tax=Streptomyces sp. NPDC048604 TaxID=3365578 RepID=UPI003718FC25
MPCASCRCELPPAARFCPSCGAPCTAAPVAGKATGRKVVTVLFCDLVGSTALSGALDAETLRSVTLRWFDLMRRQIEEQGGTVEKFIGDAVMAVFGVPAVQEDDARRAVAAALAMRDALAGLNARLEEAVGVRLDMRIGINTGQVVTGSATVRQAMVSGEVVNVAARLEQHAAAGEILIGPDTFHAAGPGVRTSRTGPLLLKGKSDRVVAHRLLGLDESDGPAALRRFDLAFVGRDHELALLNETLRQVTLTRRPARLLVAGEAGQGKSRLLHEWLTGAAARGLRHGTGRHRSRGEQSSLGPLADAVSALLAAGTATPPSPERELLDRGLLRNGTPHPSVADTCAALAKVLTDLSATGPVVLMIDDCHRAAQPLFDALDRTLRALDDAAVLTVLLTRPQLLGTRPELAPGALLLGGLADDEARLLAAELTGTAPNGVPAPVLRRAGGNPLHLEQLLLTGDATGPDGVPLPLQALIGARIDALDLPEQHVLGLASVLGGDFTPHELTALAAVPADDQELTTTLHRLVRHRLIRSDGEAFHFAGGLIQEVVYACQSKQDRADLHERAARLDSVGDRGSAVVGGHLERAHRYRVELGAQDAHTDGLRRRAADALAEAGRLALAQADPVWAADLLARAAHAYRPGEPDERTTRRRLGQTLLDLGRAAEGVALLEAVLAEGGNAGESDTADPAPAAVATRAAKSAVPAASASHAAETPPLAAAASHAAETAHARLALASAGGSGRRTEAPAEAARATLPVFAAVGDDLGQARACLRLAQEHQEEGRHRAAERLLARALAHAARSGAEPERAAALGATGVSLWRGPRPVEEAVAHCRALLAGQGAGGRAVRLTLNCPLAVLLALHDDHDGAQQCLAEAEQLARRLGYAEADAFLPIFTATVADLAGRPDAALADLERSAAASRAQGATPLLRSALLDAARIRLDHGDPSAAERTLADLAATRPPAEPAADRFRADDADLDGLHARIAAARGDHETAARLAARALAAAARTDSPIVQGVAALDFARTADALGRPADAADAAAQARRRFAAKGHLPAVRQADALAARCRSGPPPQAPSTPAPESETAR